MWKLILNNLWSRRKRNGWLMAELILVSVVTFIIIDLTVTLQRQVSHCTEGETGGLGVVCGLNQVIS